MDQLLELQLYNYNQWRSYYGANAASAPPDFSGLFSQIVQIR